MTNTTNQKLTHMAYEIKNHLKTGSEDIFIGFKKGIVSTNPFEGDDWSLSPQGLMDDIVMKNELDLDSPELIDRLVVFLRECRKISYDSDTGEIKSGRINKRVLT